MPWSVSGTGWNVAGLLKSVIDFGGLPGFRVNRPGYRLEILSHAPTLGLSVLETTNPLPQPSVENPSLVLRTSSSAATLPSSTWLMTAQLLSIALSSSLG